MLGIGTVGFEESGFLQKSPGDVHFNGPRAIAAFNDAGGRNYTGKKVPLEEDGAHWRGFVLKGELMRAYDAGKSVSAITIQALADLGYVVDVTQAVPYTLPRARAAKVAALPGDRLILGGGVEIAHERVEAACQRQVSRPVVRSAVTWTERQAAAKATALRSSIFPNPFNATPMIHYSLPQVARVRLDLYNVVGQRVSTLVDDAQDAGHYTIPSDAQDPIGPPVSAGIYFLRLQAGNERAWVEKRLLVK